MSIIQVRRKRDPFASLPFVKDGIEQTLKEVTERESDQCHTILYEIVDSAVWIQQHYQRDNGEWIQLPLCEGASDGDILGR